MITHLLEDIKKIANPEKAKNASRFFKCGNGEYGEGDIFCGVTVPEARKIAVKYKDLSQQEIARLIQSKVHEERMIAILILVHNFKRVDDKSRNDIFNFYLASTQHINNWDLVDLSADKVVGEYLKTRDRKILFKLAHSKNLWERRISIISTFAFIKDLKEYNDTFLISDILLQDEHDLIHKAVGWMLREVGKRISQEVEEEFLKPRYKKMPRTALRYAIERFPEETRKFYLK